MMKTRTKSMLLNSKLFPLVVIIAVIVVFFFAMNPGYLGKSNILILLKSASLTGILGVGVGMLLISGQIDLSTSAVAGLAGVLVALLLQHGMAWPLAVLITLGFGLVAGAIVALLVNLLNMMAFIATIGISSVWAGMAYVLTRATPVKFTNDSFIQLGSRSFFGGYVPLVFLIMLVLLVVYGILLKNTTFGRTIYICGGNRNAARLAGKNPRKVDAILFINSGGIAALGGIMLTANMRKGDPTELTQGMDAVTAAILGGISFTGGSGGMGGVFVGLMLLSLFKNGLTMVGLKSYWQILAQGLLLILALMFDYYRENKRLKMLIAGATEVAATKVVASK